VGTFYVPGRVESLTERSRGTDLPKLLVDTGSEYTWVPREILEGLGIRREKKDLQFVTATGKPVTRSVGFAIVRVENAFTVDEVVFGEPGDLSILGARSLEGMNLTVDPGHKRLVAAGPILAAAIR
jgi:predicted aspartyl protease